MPSDNKIVQVILESHLFLDTIRPGENFRRIQDDCDGDAEQVVEVHMSLDGDVWIRTGAKRPGSMMRFRTLGGGGASLRTRNALLILAEAIRLDNAERDVL